MNWKAYSGGRRGGYSYWSYAGRDNCSKFRCGVTATWRANIMLGKVSTWVYSCAAHRKEWP